MDWKGLELTRGACGLWGESSIGGYPKGLTFGAPIGLRTDSGREDFLQYYNSSIPIPPISAPRGTESGTGTSQYQAINRIEAIAKEYDVFIVSGVVERERGTLYCSVIWVDPREGLVGKRRKVRDT